MTKLLAVAALALTLSVGAIATSAPVEAAPSYGLELGPNDVNPFGAVDGN